jgi:hypothetical protein
MVYFHTKKSHFGYILEGLGGENVGIFYDPLKFLRAIWYILRTFGIVYSFGIVFPLWCVWNKTNLATLPQTNLATQPQTKN